MTFPQKLLTVLGAGALLALGAFAPAATAASPAWSPVAITGPTVIPPLQSEVQRVFVDAEGGTFTLTARQLAASGIGDLKGAQVQNLTTTSGTFAAGQAIEGFGIPDGRTITATGAGTLTLSGAPGPLSTQQALLSAYDSPASTPALPYDASAAEVQAALEALAPIGAGNVQVSGGPGGPNAENPYVVSFKGALANANVAQLSADSNLLANGGASVKTSVSGGQGTSTLALMAQNIGSIPSSGQITYKATLSSGITVAGAPFTELSTYPFLAAWSCGTSTATEIICTRNESVRPNLTPPPINATITAAPGVQSGVVQMEISGGGAATKTAELPVTVSATPSEPGIQTFVAGAYDENGVSDTRAGGHPFSASTAIFANTVRSVKGLVVPVADFKDVTVELPPGFLGNPIAVPECPESTPTQDCDLDTMVAVVEPTLERFGSQGGPTQVYNTQAPYGYPAKFRFRIAESADLSVIGTLRSDEDYGLNAASLRTPQVDQLYGVFFTFWGEPAAHSHDSLRCAVSGNPNAIMQGVGCRASNAPNTALLTSATNCAEQALHPPVTPLITTLWQEPTRVFRNTADIPAVTGCEKLEFKSSFAFQPSDSKADSPASFKTSVFVPDDGLTDPEKLITPEIRTAVVKLANGVSLNPSGADGLGACSEAQIGLKGTNFPMPNPIRFDKTPNRCPDSSKIGTGALKSALLTDPLKGDLYLAAQGDGNPFGSLFAIYLVIEDPRHGIFIKLPGKVEPDLSTGQVTVTLDNLPQVPFTTLDLTLKGGNRSAMASPPICGKYTSSMIGTPWSAPESGPPTTSPNSFDVSEGPNGMPCASSLAARPFDVGFSAGSKDPIAGAKSPFSMRITRPDGNQEIDKLEISPPPGFVASLKGIPYCSEAQIAAAHSKDGRDEQNNPSCPAASQIGTTNSGAGAGPSPFYAPGKLYLAGPYKGETLSVLSVTPAVAGPFDLGNVVIRAALKLDPRTARITAISDPIPQVVEGVPLRARDIRIELDRPNWAQNPTNCEAMSVDATVFGSNGAVSHPSNRFQVGGCENLGFKPKLEIHLKGGTKRGDHPALLATLSTRDGDANIARAAVTLPPSAFLDQAHIRTVCTRVQFAANACPKGAIYGYGKAVTELLDDPIEGNVYLRSSNNKLPDLVAALKGVANIEAVGRIDSVKGGIRNTFDIIPDAPFDTFTLKMQGGKKGLVVNSQNLCAKAHRATVRLTAQNGRTHNFRPKVIADNCTKAKKGKRAQKRGHRR